MFFRQSYILNFVNIQGPESEFEPRYRSNVIARYQKKLLRRVSYIWEQPYTHNPPRDPFGGTEPPCQIHLKENLDSFLGGRKIYPDHTNNLCKAVLAPPNFPTMGDLWRKQDERVDIEKEPDVSKKKS